MHPGCLSLLSLSLWILSSGNGWAGTPAEMEAGWKSLKTTDASWIRWMQSWVEEDSLSKLPEFLDTRGNDESASAVELRLAAETWRFLDESQKAAQTMRQAADQFPDDHALRLEAARYLARIRQFPQALAALDKIPADVSTDLALEAMLLRWQLARHAPDAKQTLAKLRKQAEERPADPVLLQSTFLWAFEPDARGDSAISEADVAWLRKKIAEEPTPAIRAGWQKLLVTHLAREGQLSENPGDAIEWLLNTAKGSEDERQAMCGVLRTLEFKIRPSSGKRQPTPHLSDLASNLADRPAALAGLLNWLANQNRADEALHLLDQHPQPFLEHQRLPLLALADRHAEAVAWYQRRGDLDALLHAAMLMRDLGQNEQAARDLESWAARAGSTQADSERILPVLSLLRSPAEMVLWIQQAASRFPASPIFTPGRPNKKSDSNADDEVSREMKAAMAIPSQAESLKVLHELRRKHPQEVRVAATLLHMLEDAEIRVLLRAWELEAAGDRRQLECLREVRGYILYRKSLAEPELFLPDNSHPKNIPAADKAEALLKESRQDELSMLAAIEVPSAALRLVQARAAFQRHQPEEAARELLPLAMDEALKVDVAEEAALDLMAWQMLPEAKAFIQAQRARFPDNYRFQHLLALVDRESGDIQSAIATLLALGSLSEKPDTAEFMKQSDFDIRSLWWRKDETQVRPPPPVMTREVTGELGTLAGVPQWLAGKFGRGDDHHPHHIPLPKNRREARIWATAHLLYLSQSFSQQDKETLAIQAAGAGLPVPALIHLGQINRGEHYLTLDMDTASIEQRLEDVPTALLWLEQNAPYRPTSMDESYRLRAQKFMPRIVATLRKAGWKPADQFKAAEYWWWLEPANSQAILAAAEAVALPGNETTRLEFQTTLTIPQRRDPAWQQAMVRLLKAYTTDDRSKQVDNVRAFLAMGRWEEAAAQFNQTDPFPFEPNAGLRQAAEGEPPGWLFKFEPRTPLIGSQHMQESFLFTPQNYRDRPTFKWELAGEVERAAFVTAASQLKNPSLRLAWLRAAGDNNMIEKALAQWLQQEPGNDLLLLATASQAAANGDTTRAFELLHNGIPAEPGIKRGIAQMNYVRAVLSARQSQDPFAAQPTQGSQGADDIQKQRVKTIIQEWLPELEKHAQVLPYREVWHQWLSVIGMTEEAQRLFPQAVPPQAVPPQIRALPGQHLMLMSDRLWRAPEEEGARRLQSMQGLFQPHWESLREVDSSEKFNADQRAQLVPACMFMLRWQMDHVFFGWPSGKRPEDSVEEVRETISKLDLAGDIMRRVEPGRVRSWRALAHAGYAADLCGQWQKARDLLGEADHLKPGDPVVRSMMLKLDLQLGVTPAALTESLKTMQPFQDRQILSFLISEALKTREDYPLRIAMAEVAVNCIQQRPELLTSRSADLDPDPWIENLFKVFDSFSSKTIGLPSLFGRGNSASWLEQPAEHLLNLRKNLHNQLCDLLLEQEPPQSGEPLEQILNRYLKVDKPATEDLLAWLGRADAATVDWRFIHNILVTNQSSLSLPERGRLARLAVSLPHDLAVHGQYSVLQFIGQRVEIPPSNLPALWQWPFPITTGSRPHHAEQNAWHEERTRLFDEYSATALKGANVNADVFVIWAGWALHDEARSAEVLRVARGLYLGKPELPTLLPFVEMMERSYSNDHHIRAAEVIATLLEETKPAPHKASVDYFFKPLVTLLLKGRPGKDAPMPPISLAPGDAQTLDPPFSAAMQQRRQAVYKRLQPWLGEIPETRR